MEHTKHIWRVALILAAMGILGVSVRQLLIPKSFGATGFYRYDSLGEFMSAQPVHGNETACTACHTETADAKAEGGHASVSCEVCHAPLATHAQGEEKTGDMAINRSHKVCAYCHQKLRARPDSIAQIDLTEHLGDADVLEPGEDIPEGVCTVCHDPHAG